MDQLFERVSVEGFGVQPKDFAFTLADGSANPSVPLSPLWSITTVTSGYLLVIVLLTQLMRKREKAFSVKGVWALHNTSVCVLSLVLLLLIVENLLPFIQHGPFFTICSSQISAHRKLEFFFYLNYLFKYYELLDTMFILLSKKQLDFLHVYHHTATVWLCYSQLLGRTAVQWVPITANLVVHVVMYYYYARAALGAKLWWKKYLTTLQIVQFVVDLVVISIASGSFVVEHYFPHLWPGLACAGTGPAAAFGAFIISSYLFLFIRFYIKTYQKNTHSAHQKEN